MKKGEVEPIASGAWRTLKSGRLPVLASRALQTRSSTILSELGLYWATPYKHYVTKIPHRTTFWWGNTTFEARSIRWAKAKGIQWWVSFSSIPFVSHGVLPLFWDKRYGCLISLFMDCGQPWILTFNNYFSFNTNYHLMVVCLILHIIAWLSSKK